MLVRTAPGRRLVDQQALAVLTERSPSVVLRHCSVVACDVATRRGLYDADESRPILDAVPRRRRRTPGGRGSGALRPG